MSSTKVTDPNAKGNSGFLWAIVAVLIIAAVVVGFIVFRGQSATVDRYAERERTEVAAEAEYTDGAITLAASGAAEGAEEVEIYEDYSCSYCADLAEETDERMLQEIEDGNVVVHLRPLNFLDQGSVGHSTEALAASLALISRGEVETYWNLREVMMEEQTEIYNQWGADDFADAAAGLGASDEAADAIRAEEHLDEAVELAEGNASRLEELSGSVSSPRILQDGQVIAEQDPTQWMNEVLGA